MRPSRPARGHIRPIRCHASPAANRICPWRSGTWARPSWDVASFGADRASQRVAQPEELSPAYVFLASPITASYITGIVQPVTGDIGAI